MGEPVEDRSLAWIAQPVLFPGSNLRTNIAERSVVMISMKRKPFSPAAER